MASGLWCEDRQMNGPRDRPPREAEFAQVDMDDTETVALIRDGHAFGKKRGATERAFL